MLQIFVHFAKRSKIFFGINNNYFGGKQHACADLTSVQNWFASAGWAATLSDQRQEERLIYERLPHYGGSWGLAEQPGSTESHVRPPPLP